ncbi:MAG: hypothetical protein ACK5CA_07940 [Cyanobacteriota bacterium]
MSIFLKIGFNHSYNEETLRIDAPLGDSFPIFPELKRSLKISLIGEAAQEKALLTYPPVRRKTAPAASANGVSSFPLSIILKD